MSDLFGNHIVGFPTRRLKCVTHDNLASSETMSKLKVSSEGQKKYRMEQPVDYVTITKTRPCNIQRLFSAV